MMNKEYFEIICHGALCSKSSLTIICVNNIHIIIILISFVKAVADFGVADN